MVFSTSLLATALLFALATIVVAANEGSDDTVIDTSFRSPTLNKRLCESCFYHPQCNTGYCHNRKCVKSLKKDGILSCNRPECSRCDSRLVCRSNKCWGPPGQERCIQNTDASREKCFPNLDSPDSMPPLLASECETCERDIECESRICRRGKCVEGTIESLKRCFGRPFCSRCTRGSQCKNAICFNGRCTGRALKSKYRCFGRPECEPCTKDKQCASDNCVTVGNVSKCAMRGEESKCFM